MHGSAAAFPGRTGIFEQLFSSYGLPSLLRQLCNDFRVVRQARQIGLGQPTFVAPSLHRRRSVSKPFRDGGEPNMVNCACDGAHLYESVHQLCKVTIDRKCKRGGSDLPGGTRHPHNDVLGAARGSEPGCRLAVWSIGYRPRARRLAERRSEMARWGKPSGPQEYDHPGQAPGSES